MDEKVYRAYVDILHEELVPAMGCTEPIAVAYAGALARKTLGALPERTVLTVSRNIIKNVKSVVVPHTDGKKGLRAAVAAGICFGDADRELEVLADATDEQIAQMGSWLEQADIQVLDSDAGNPFDLHVEVFAGDQSAYVRIVGNHTNVVVVRRNDELLVNEPFDDGELTPPENRSLLTVDDIVTFANEVDVDDVRDVLQRQIDDNLAIVQAGLSGEYGAAIGKILLMSYGNSVSNRAKAWAAAGSDARMGGCELPVVINSGSGSRGSPRRCRWLFTRASAVCRTSSCCARSSCPT